MCSSTHLALNGFTIVTCVGCAREHRVLPRDPAETTVFTPARNTGRKRGGAQHAGSSELDQAGAFGLIDPPPLEGDGTEFIGRTAIATSHGPTLASASFVSD